VEEKRFTDLESTASILARYDDLALRQRELALVSVGRRVLDVTGDQEEEARLKIATDALSLYTEFLAFGLSRFDGSMITFTGNVSAGVPNLMESPITKRSFIHARSGTRISIGEPYYFELLNDWILPIRAPMFKNDSLVAIGMSALRYKSINDNLESFGIDSRYRIHSINTAFNTTQVYYPLEATQYAELLRKDANIYDDLEVIETKNGIERILGFNTFEGYRMMGVRIFSQDIDKAFIVSVNSNIVIHLFWSQFRLILIAYLLLVSASFFGINYLIKKDRKHKDDLAEQNRKLEQLVEDRTKKLKFTNKELSATNGDLTKALRELKDAQDQLIQSEKMASLGVLVAGVGHEINNPLNFIQGGYTALVELLEPKASKEMATYLEVIAEGVKRCTAIIESLSNYSRQAGDMHEECNVQSILDNCLLILANKIKSKIKVEKQYLQEEVVVEGNEGKLHQVFMNVLTNADQSIEDNGVIALTCSMEKGYAIISIKDTGGGIKKGDMNKIGDPFFTTKAPGKGTGLGLSIAYSIVEEHGGTITCESTFKKGTEFVIRLPLTKTTISV